MAREMVEGGQRVKAVAEIFRVSPARISQVVRRPARPVSVTIPDHVPVDLRADYRALVIERGKAVADGWLSMRMRQP
jgi:hypothetical protein